MNEMQMKNDNAETMNQTQAAESVGSLAVVGRESAPSAAKVTLRTLRAETEMQAISQALAQTGLESQARGAIAEHQLPGIALQDSATQHHEGPKHVGVPKRAKMADTLNWDSSSLPSRWRGSEQRLMAGASTRRAKMGSPGPEACALVAAGRG